MKNIKRNVLAMTLALALALPPTAGASWALGTELHQAKTTLAQGVESVTQSLWSATYSDLRTEHYITYTPSEGIYPVVVYGEKVTDRKTLSSMAATLESEGKRVLGGINGDYYVMSTGAPLGMVLSDGILRSTPQYTDSWALGFLEDGTAFISQPELSVTATFRGMTLAISGGINKARTVQGGYYLLTDEFAADTKNTEAGVDVILRPLSEALEETVEVDQPVEQDAAQDSETPVEETEGVSTQSAAADEPEGIATTDPADEEPVTDSEEIKPEDVTVEEEQPDRVTATLVRSEELRIGSVVTCEVVGVYQNSKAIEVPEGHYVLTINARGNEWLVEQLASLTVGEQMQINIVSSDARWNEAVTGIGGMYRILNNGQVVDGLDKERAPRSAVGIKADGSTVFYTLDGRQPGYSVGGTLSQVAERLAELGCVEAVCMDGGGSTTFGITEADGQNMTIQNQPSGGSQRANSNALFLVSELEPSGTLNRLHVTPYDNLLLAGSSLQVYAVGVDTSGYPMARLQDVTWSVEDGEGLISADGVFLSGKQAGTVRLTAQSGTAKGETSVTVVSQVDLLEVRDEATGAAVNQLALEPGQSIELTASATWRNLSLTSQDSAFVWTADPAVGSVDANGRFTASEHSGTGNLTVSAGGRSVTIPVQVTGHIRELESFEESVMNLIGTTTALAEQETDLEHVRFGRASARVDYDATNGAAVLATTLAVPSGERYLSLWVYGDESGNSLLLHTADPEGNQSDTVLGALNFAGWQRVTAHLPENTADVRGISVIYGGGEKAVSTIWLDQLTTANEDMVDEEPPVIEMAVNGTELKVVVSDVLDHALTQKSVTVALDGQTLDFQWNPQGIVTATVPADTELRHRVTVTVRDASGNLARESLDYFYGDSSEEVFLDMEGHWAQPYTAYLVQQGISNGVQTEQGYEFRPENLITRGEFALMVARWQGLAMENYAEVELPFADADQIPDWCRSAVQAMYAEGILNGSLEGDALYANAQKGISRVEAMAILGRLQSKGYPTKELDFTDADAVPAWAEEHVKTLVCQGVVSGYDGLLRPQDGVKRGEVAKMLVSLI